MQVCELLTAGLISTSKIYRVDFSLHRERYLVAAIIS